MKKLISPSREASENEEPKSAIAVAAASWSAPALWRFFHRARTESGRGRAQSKTWRQFEWFKGSLDLKNWMRLETVNLFGFRLQAASTA